MATRLHPPSLTVACAGLFGQCDIRAMPKQKPSRKVLTSFKTTNTVVHWGFHRDLDVDERPFVGEMKVGDCLWQKIHKRDA